MLAVMKVAKSGSGKAEMMGAAMVDMKVGKKAATKGLMVSLWVVWWVQPLAVVMGAVMVGLKVEMLADNSALGKVAWSVASRAALTVLMKAGSMAVWTGGILVALMAALMAVQMVVTWDIGLFDTILANEPSSVAIDFP